MRRAGLFLLIGAGISGLAPAGESSSPSFVLEVSGFSMGGEGSESASFTLDDTLGAPVEGGETSSASFRSEAGVVDVGLDPDGDGVLVGDDLCPGEYSGCYDLDGDGCIDTPDVDQDGDGVTAGSCDCSDRDGAIWARPSEVRDVRFLRNEVGQTVLTWDLPLEPGGISPRFDTLRSVEPTTPLGATVCVETDDASDTEAIATDAPPPAESFYYLVRAENECASGSGPLGLSRGLYARQAPSCR